VERWLRISRFRATRSTMFVRFRQTARRLQASLSATRWDAGRVRHEHVAGLGSVPLSPSAADRIEFWTQLHQRLEALGNRVDAAHRGAILTAIHARVPMPTMDDHQAVQLERAQADARFWETLADMQTGNVEEHKQLLITVQRTIAERGPLAADTAAKAEAAKVRLERLEKGEAVAGIPAPMTRADLLRISGMSEAQMLHCQRVAAIAAKGDDWWRLMTDEAARRKAKVEKTVVRQLHRRAMGDV
jgi:hypothetical protein